MRVQQSTYGTILVVYNGNLAQTPGRSNTTSYTGTLQLCTIPVKQESKQCWIGKLQVELEKDSYDTVPPTQPPAPRNQAGPYPPKQPCPGRIAWPTSLLISLVKF